MICPYCGKQTINLLKCDACGSSTEFAKRTNYQSVGTSENEIAAPSVTMTDPIPQEVVEKQQRQEGRVLAEEEPNADRKQTVNQQRRRTEIRMLGLSAVVVGAVIGCFVVGIYTAKVKAENKLLERERTAAIEQLEQLKKDNQELEDALEEAKRELSEASEGESVVETTEEADMVETEIKEADTVETEIKEADTEATQIGETEKVEIEEAETGDSSSGDDE